MPAPSATLRVPGLSRQKLTAVSRKARALGISPEQYVKQLVEADLRLDQLAIDQSFSRIMGTTPAADERELDVLVEKVRSSHHVRRARQKR